MTGLLQCVVLDGPDPHALAAFYQELLGGTIDQPDARWSLDADWSTLHLPSGVVLCFQRVVEHRPPRWPDPEHPQQLHLDIEVDDLVDAERRMRALGGVRLDSGDLGWLVCADPAGHPFCLLPAPRTSVTAG